jgi:hypothetical protein
MHDGVFLSSFFCRHKSKKLESSVMNTACFPRRLIASATRRCAFVGVVLAVVGLMTVSTGALQWFSSLRAFQNESSEGRSEHETSERAHVAVLQLRSAKTRSNIFYRRDYKSETLAIHRAVNRALAENSCRVPSIVLWSSTMRC